MAGNDSYTKLLLHCNGTNGSQSFPDSSASNHTIIAGGTAQVSTANYKFASGSLLLDGSVNCFIDTSSSDDFDFGTGDFTIDFWAYNLSIDGTTVIQNYLSAWGMTVGYLSSGTLYLFATNVTGSWGIASAVSMGSAPGLNWVHYALVRNGNNWYTFRNGTQISTFTNGATIYNPGGGKYFGVGNYTDTSDNGHFMAGNIDEIRISKGVARWTTNFDVPTQEYSVDSTQYTILSDAKIFGTNQQSILSNSDIIFASTQYTILSDAKIFGTNQQSILSNSDIIFANGNDTYTKLLLHCDGIDGSTTFTDSSASAHIVTANGDAQIDIAQSKFGGASGLFDGINNTNLSVPDSSDWFFGTIPFTIDFWVRFNSITSNPTLIGQFQDANNYWSIQYNSGKFYFTSITNDIIDLQFHSYFTPTLNTWYHVAIESLAEGYWALFINGIAKPQLLDVGSYSSPISDFSGSLYIGSWFTGTSNQLDGWIDELRISKGISRYLANFTPSSASYGSTQQIILTDTKIKSLGVQSEILSDANIISSTQQYLLSDTKIKVDNNQEIILSDAKIIIQQTVLSDAEIKIVEQQAIQSNSDIKSLGNQHTILSDARIIASTQQTILLDAKIKSLNNQQTILSNAKIVITVIYDVLNKFNSAKQNLSDVLNKFNSVKQIVSDITNYINTVKSTIYDIANDIRTQARGIYDVTNDIRFLRSSQLSGNAGFQSLGKTYIHVYFNSIEQIDVDVDSVVINKNINGSHTLSLDLARAYDTTVPALETVVEVYYNTWKLYEGYITEINPSETPEHINIVCQDKYWKDNRQNSYFHVGYKPYNNNEKYYEKINDAIGAEFGWGLTVGNFLPEQIDAFAVGKADALTSLITQCGNFGWFYDEYFNKKLWQAGYGSIVNIERQSLGTNLGLYQLLNHQFKEDASQIVNKYRVQMGDKTLTYTAFNYSNYTSFAYPAWDASLEVLAKWPSPAYGWNNPAPRDEDKYKDVFKKYSLPFINPELSTWSDRYPPQVKLFSPWNKMYGSASGVMTEGFTVDYQNKTITFNEPIYMVQTDTNGEWTAIAAPTVKLFLWKKNYYNETVTPIEDPETAVSNPLLFFTSKVGSYPSTVIKYIELPNFGIQQGLYQIEGYGNRIDNIYTWDDTAFAEDYVYWLLSNSAEIKITGTIELTLDAVCFYGIDLTKRIFINGITGSAMNVTSMNYNINNFTVTITLENSQAFSRTQSFPYHGE